MDDKHRSSWQLIGGFGSATLHKVYLYLRYRFIDHDLHEIGQDKIFDNSDKLYTKDNKTAEPLIKFKPHGASESLTPYNPLVT